MNELSRTPERAPTEAASELSLRRLLAELRDSGFLARDVAESAVPDVVRVTRAMIALCEHAGASVEPADVLAAVAAAFEAGMTTAEMRAAWRCLRTSADWQDMIRYGKGKPFTAATLVRCRSGYWTGGMGRTSTAGQDPSDWRHPDYDPARDPLKAYAGHNAVVGATYDYPSDGARAEAMRRFAPGPKARAAGALPAPPAES